MSRNRVVVPLPLRVTPTVGASLVERWPVIVADPPWRFGDRGSRFAPDQRKKRMGRKGYRTLTVEQIAAIPVREVVERDALLFLWTTSSHEVDGSARRVCEAWGFTPKTTIAWVKGRAVGYELWRALHNLVALRNPDLGLEPRVRERLARKAWRDAERALELYDNPAKDLLPLLQIGGGHYTRGAHELVVVASRGRGVGLVKDHGVASAFIAPRERGHSGKPERFRDLVDRLTGKAPVLELFARTERPGWTIWGDQAPASTERLCG